MLKFSPIKSFLLLPILSLLTLFVLPIWIYWSSELKAKFMYSRVANLLSATHLLVEGKDGNIEIV